MITPPGPGISIPASSITAGDPCALLKANAPQSYIACRKARGLPVPVTGGGVASVMYRITIA